MRPLLLGDLEQAARVLMPLPPETRADRAGEILTRARTADLYRKHTGKRHPDWGNGSVFDVCLGLPRAELRYPATGEFHAALSVFLAVYLEGRVR